MTFYLGLTGGIATGKSTASRLLREMGCQVIDSDLIAHQQAEVGQVSWQKILKEFGAEFFNSDHSLNRQALGKYVFANPEALAKLSKITQGEVLKEVQKQMKESTAKVCVIDVPLLFEAGWQEYFDAILLIAAPEETELARLMKRDSLSRQEAEQRMRAQLPLAEKRLLASYVLENTGTIEELRDKLSRLLKTIA
ncbi:dephospho-CoA kinase [Lactobacillus nasalidis]|uniref:Dephospho-CoA kinase n=1 Tax=Lactobacillus nasalidis TaxID=2797258 RepID=A0ABQ3W6E7_9LACO|nr:dephospho-CoA kinase [Lactobacillus nasalidis]GHV98013.1 dephospho-CoA kinase [Lactobacillus nasalidis]GHV99268.1 dephospho-CoA kinase [Lactobacillus nasalidis]GHW02051.1 dephospho-CoA kinase [Lactobacillus nasalidis]